MKATQLGIDWGDPTLISTRIKTTYTCTIFLGWLSKNVWIPFHTGRITQKIYTFAHNRTTFKLQISCKHAHNGDGQLTWKPLCMCVYVVICFPCVLYRSIMNYCLKQFWIKPIPEQHLWGMGIRSSAKNNWDTRRGEEENGKIYGVSEQN